MSTTQLRTVEGPLSKLPNVLCCEMSMSNDTVMKILHRTLYIKISEDLKAKRLGCSFVSGLLHSRATCHFYAEECQVNVLIPIYNAFCI